MGQDPPWTPPAARPAFPEFGARIGLIGDVHGDLDFLQAAVHALDAHRVDSIVQLGDLEVIGAGPDRGRADLAILNTALSLVDRRLLVVLGNHDHRPAIAALPADADGVRRRGRIGILPPGGRGTAAGRALGWLAGAASIDLNHRDPSSWWAAELPTDAEAAPFLTGGPVEIVLAHDALASRALTERLARTADLWDPDALAYAAHGRAQFTDRVLTVLTDGGLVASGHYHARLAVDEVLTRPGGAPVRVRNEILADRWNPDSVGILDTATLTIESFSVDLRQGAGRTTEFRDLLRTIPDPDEYVPALLALRRHEFAQLRNGILHVPPGMLAYLRRHFE